MKIILLSLMIVVTLSAHSDNNNSQLNDCKNAVELEVSKSIVKHCLTLEKDTKNREVLAITAELLQKISYNRINEIFGLGEDNSYLTEFKFNKKLYSTLEKHYLKDAFNRLNKYEDIHYAFIGMLYAKIAYINIMYFEMYESNVIDIESIEREKNLKSKIYVPYLKQYLQKHPKDEEALYLLGMQALKLTFPQNTNPKLTYRKVVNEELFKYLKKSDALNFYKAKEAMESVSNWQKYMVKLNKAANSNDTEALYKIGLQNYNRYIDNGFKEQEYLELAIINFEKAQVLGHENALAILAGIYFSAKPNKIKYTEYLEKSINLYGDGYYARGNLYWCNGDKIKAKEMYIKSSNKGGINSSEAELSLEDLTTLNEPFNGCGFK